MAALQNGARLGAYEILGPLGTGGMGNVYRARDTRLDRTVAIKILKAELNGNALNRQRFEREARSVAALAHPHICTLHDVGDHEGDQFIVMELLQGQTLATRLIAARHGLPVDEALAIAAQLADALSFAHKHQIVHRDIKPGNIMLTPTGVKLLDFGLARLRDRNDAGNVSRTETMLTADRAVMGTLPYMSPEQIDGRADHRSDIFAFGAVLFEMLSGRRMFDSETSSAIIAAIVQHEVPPLPALRPEISPALDRVVRRCLAKDPDKRWQSAADLADELRWIREHPADRPTQAKTSRSWRLALAVILGLALAATAFSAGWVVRNLGAGNAPGAELPTWRRLTFGEGYVHNARFGPDGQTILYSASWDGKPFQVFSTTTLSPESRALELPAAGLLAVSRSGQLALTLSCGFIGANGNCLGTLARAPFLGGAPRPLAENAQSADWGPNDTLAAVVSNRLEAPLGTRLTDQPVNHVRVSPDGQRLASSEREQDGWAVTVREGQIRQVLSRGWIFVSGLAWSPDGSAVFVSGMGPANADDAVSRIEMDGTARTVLRSGPRVRVLDAARTNRLLIDQSKGWPLTWIQDPNSAAGRRDLTWLGSSMVDAISKNGEMVLLTVRAGPTLGGGRRLKSIELYPIYSRPTDGGPATLLGTGYGHALSDDGRWALTSTREGRDSKFIVHPLGPGSSRTLDRGGLDMSNTQNLDMTVSFAGLDRIVFDARRGEGPMETWVQSISGEPPTRVEHEPGRVVSPVAPDGNRFVSQRRDGSLWMATLEPRASTRLPFTLQPNQRIRQWSEDGRQLFVATRSDERWVVTKVNVDTGRILPHAEIRRDRASSLTPFLRISRDGRTIVYTDERTDSAVFLIDGVK